MTVLLVVATLGWLVLGTLLLASCEPRPRGLYVFKEVDPLELERIMAEPGPFDPQDFDG